MQTPFSGKSGILPELPRALHLESGIVGKYGLSDGNGCGPAFSDAFVLDVFLSRRFYQINKREKGEKRLTILNKPLYFSPFNLLTFSFR